MMNWRYLENGELDMEWIHEQEPDISESTNEVLEFINTIANKVTLIDLCLTG